MFFLNITFFLMLGAIIQKGTESSLKALFLNIMQFISPFYDENSRRSIYLMYKNIRVGK